MNTPTVIGLFLVTWILIGAIHLSTVRQPAAPEMPTGSIEKEFNGIKYYLVPVGSE